MAEHNPGTCVLDRDSLDGLLSALRHRGFRTVGPVFRDGAIVLDTLSSAGDLPWGWRDQQGPGRYRLERAGDAAFGCSAPAQSWKRFLFPPEERLFEVKRGGSERGLTFLSRDTPIESYALIGVRPCDLNAILVHDRVLNHGAHRDRAYAARRERSFVLAVNCTHAGGTCFCASMGTGPRAASGFDLAMTELPGPNGPTFVVEVGSERGGELLSELPRRPAADDELRSVDDGIEGARRAMGRRLETEGLKELLQRSPDHPRWQDAARRCLTCGNCTMACPTCFCTDVSDVTDLSSGHAARIRRWDSCFNLGFSYIHGGPMRRSVSARYRHWMTHKLASWFDQFGSSGCVGCGRCITWCPAGIDITEEARAIRGTAAKEG
jgi:ferredoxin